MPRTAIGPLAALLVAASLLFAACSDDDGGDVRAVGDGSSSASGSGSGSGSASATAEAPCNPVGEDLAEDADNVIEVELKDFAFDPASIDTPAGVTTFRASNTGSQNHELAFLPGGGDVPFTDEGAPDEAALEAAGAFELEGFGAGQTCDATYQLEPGDYTLFCIVEAPDGETHASKGMLGELTVA